MERKMEVVFKDYGVKFDLPEGVIYYNKNDVLKLLEYNEALRKNCIMVLGNSGLKTFAIINYLGKVSSQEEFKDIVNASAQENKNLGMTIYSHDRLVSQDGRELYVQVYKLQNTFTTTIFSRIDDNVIICNCSSDKENFEKTYDFALKIMQGLFKAD